MTNTRICETTESFVVVPPPSIQGGGMRLFKVVASFLSLSFPRESELLSVILPANLRRPIKRMECNVSADFFFPSLSLSLF